MSDNEMNNNGVVITHLPVSTSVSTSSLKYNDRNPVTDELVGRALKGLANEAQNYYSKYYFKTKCWRAVQTILVAIGSIGPLVVGGIVIAVPSWSMSAGISSMVVGLFSSLSNMSFIQKLLTTYETAGDDFKKLGLSVQYATVLGATQNKTPDITQFLDQLQTLIDKHEDPGSMNLEQFRWVHDHIESNDVSQLNQLELVV